MELNKNQTPVTPEENLQTTETLEIVETPAEVSENVQTQTAVAQEKIAQNSTENAVETQNNNVEQIASIELTNTPKNEKTGSNTNKTLLGLVILLFIIVLGLTGYIVYDKFIANDKPKTSNSSEQTTNNGEQVTNDNTNATDDVITNNKDSDTSKNEIVSEGSKLLNEELTIDKICTNTSGICNKEVGKFTLNGIEHTLKVNINMGDENNATLYEKLGNSELAVKNNEKANSISIDSKKIVLGYNSSLDKIVKIDDKYLAVGVNVGFNTGYEIRIYNSNFNLLKTYSSIHVSKEIARDEKMVKNFSEYFKVVNNTFTRYSCNTSKDTGDGTNQILEKYKVTIVNGNFTESKESQVTEYCSAQD